MKIQLYIDIQFNKIQIRSCGINKKKFFPSKISYLSQIALMYFLNKLISVKDCVITKQILAILIKGLKNLPIFFVTLTFLKKTMF